MMKQLITTLITAVLIIHNCSSQLVYQPMAIEDATWLLAGYGEAQQTAEAYKIKGDTTVNNLNYKKLYHYKLEVINPPSREFLLEDQNLFALLRDDSNSRKVYALPISQNLINTVISETCHDLMSQPDEFLLYDFSVSLGDTLSECMMDDSWKIDDYNVVKVDTLLYKYDKFTRGLATTQILFLNQEYLC